MTKSDPSSRPAIPAELRRQILFECSHKCAVCGHPQVDLHHIIPWEKCKEHRHANLIALCPNCHRRADSGDIDRKSLREYKELPYAMRLNQDSGRIVDDVHVEHKGRPTRLRPRALIMTMNFIPFNSSLTVFGHITSKLPRLAQGMSSLAFQGKILAWT